MGYLKKTNSGKLVAFNVHSKTPLVETQFQHLIVINKFSLTFILFE